jgi:anti-anti-sigma regulatory factor
MELILEEVTGPVKATVLCLSGNLDGSNFDQLIAKGREVIAGGAENIILDLSACGFMSSAGLVALHSLALLARGEEPPDPQHGWAAFHALSQDAGSGVQKNFKLVAPQPSVLRLLEKTGMTGFLEVFDEADAALASF